MNSQNTTPKVKETEDYTWLLIIPVLLILSFLSSVFDKVGLVLGWILIGLGAILTIISFVQLNRTLKRVEKSKILFEDYAKIISIFFLWAAIVAIPIIGIYQSYYLVIQPSFITKGIRMFGFIIAGLLIISNSILTFRFLNSYHKTSRSFEFNRFEKWIIENTWIIIIFELVFVVLGIISVFYTSHALDKNL